VLKVGFTFLSGAGAFSRSIIYLIISRAGGGGGGSRYSEEYGRRSYLEEMTDIYLEDFCEVYVLEGGVSGVIVN
jgi:hypothetical protein